MPAHYLIRHGQAQPAGAGVPDSARALTAPGREDVARVARHLAALGLGVDEIRHSGLTRARETAEILAGALRPARGVHTARGLQSDDDPRVAAGALEEAADSVALVGHQPHLGRLLAHLVAAPERELLRFPPVTVVRLVREGAGWAVDWVLTPGAVPGA